MALITNTTDVTPDASTTWEIPPGARIDRSVIPRGMLTFDGGIAVSALGAGDTLRFRIRFMFPTNWMYMLKIFSMNFASDDQTISMEANGLATFNTLDGNFHNAMVSEVVYEYSTAQALVNQYRLVEPIPSVLLSGPGGDHFIAALADITPTSVAGDVFYHMEFYKYDIEQVAKYPLHTQVPIRT